MIPADLASRLRLVSQDLPAPTQPVAQARQLTDVLSELSTGQRIMAEIQALLPNGSYRAIVGQREITLALPFAAKAGDTLELEVVETDGKLSLAFIANRSAAEAAAKPNDSVATTLSKTGHLIGNLLNEVEQQGGRAKPTALNANQPLVTQFPEQASELAPILKDSLIKSGMFYEAHQARWVEGKLPTANLLLEPQGKLSTLIPSTPSFLETPAPQTKEGLSAAEITDHVHLSEASLQKTASDFEINKPSISQSEAGAVDSRNTALPARETLSQSSNIDPASTGQRSAAVHPELTPIVQQQLNALASQTYVWQGQVWPGQNMDWEITEDDGRPRSGDQEMAAQWKTRLKLDLPNLGGIEARLALGTSGKLSLSLLTNNQASQGTLQAAGSELEKSLKTAGLQLNNFVVNHGEISG
jgi:hypothetical protein